MLRSALLYLSNQPQVFSFVRHNKLAKHLAMRFVAGETADDALGAVRQLNARGASASLDLLGESVTNEAEARATRDAYLHLLDRLQDQRLDANVSVKLTALGRDISEDLCVALMQDVSGGARSMVTSCASTWSLAPTRSGRLDFRERLYPLQEPRRYRLQSYLYRSSPLYRQELRCGAPLARRYKEPASVAYPDSVPSIELRRSIHA